MLKKLLGIAPQLESDGSYSPSKLALKLGTVDKTDYEAVEYEKYLGSKKKILVVFTEQKNMKMLNGKLFSTGNNPIETFLPMLHLKQAGFEFEIATPTGKPAIIEKWAFPEKDEHVKSINKEYESDFANPISLAEFVDQSFSDVSSYAAIFIPGGHGAMLGLPEDRNVNKVLMWAHQNDLFTISICHGPGAFLSLTLDGQEFLYRGYNMTVFPDSYDKKTPAIGYLPGHMPMGLSEHLIELGANVLNTKVDKSVCRDRKLITGASPLASNELGVLAATTLSSELE